VIGWCITSALSVLQLFHGCDRMVVGFTTTYPNSAYHH